jgi:hypothetical protein
MAERVTDLLVRINRHRNSLTEEEMRGFYLALGRAISYTEGEQRLKLLKLLPAGERAEISGLEDRIKYIMPKGELIYEDTIYLEAMLAKMEDYRLKL